MKIQKTFLFLLSCAMAGCSFAQPKKDTDNSKSSVNTKKNQQAVQSTNTLLWEITGNGLQKPSYVFGTMHVLCAGDANLSDNLKNVIKESEQIFFEIDMDNIIEMMGAMRFLRMNDGKKISDLLSAEDYEKLKQYFEDNPSMMPFSMMNRFKPYFVSSLIGERMMDCEKTNGMEQLIMQESQQYKKDIRGLETIEFQASIFDSIPYEKQAKDLVTYIDSIDNYRKVMTEMIDVYKKQDLKKMEILMLQSDPGMEEYMGLLLFDRNHRWIDIIQKNMAEKQTLFAVGAGHLPGKEGVLQLLKNKKYTVKPVAN